MRPLRARVGGYKWAVLRNGGLRYPPASESILHTLATRLGETLPGSYREFLLTSNGWLTYWARLLPADEVAPLQIRDPEVVLDWSSEAGGVPISDEEYDVYGPEQKAALFRREYLPHAVEVSEQIETWSTYLLCPCKKFADGEWEAWRMSAPLAGAQRFRSFAELMRFVEQREFTELDAGRLAYS